MTFNFQKDGSDPELSRVPVLPGLPGGKSWPAFAEQAAAAAKAFVEAALGAMGMTRDRAQPEDHLRHRRSRGRPERAKRRPNMLHVSRRTRRKHRRARKAA